MKHIRRFTCKKMANTNGGQIYVFKSVYSTTKIPYECSKEYPVLV